MGIFGRRVEQPADLERALADAFAHDGPAVVDVVTARQELSIPPGITAEQAKGFSLYAIRTILAGRADELLDLVTHQRGPPDAGLRGRTPSAGCVQRVGAAQVRTFNNRRAVCGGTMFSESTSSVCVDTRVARRAED